MDEALLTRVEKQAWFHRYPRGLPFALFCFGLVMTALFIIGIERADENARAMRLDRDAASLVASLQRKAAENIAYLNAAAALFSVAEEVSPQEFARFVEEMSVGHLARGSLGLGWAAWIRGGAVDAYQEQQRELLMSRDFVINPRPASASTRMAVIGLLEPQTPANYSALGYDMYSEPVRRAAIDAAIRSGRVGVSRRVHLVQDKDRPTVAGILIYVPVYERAGPGSRRTRGPLKGFVYTPIRMQDFLETAMADLDGTPAAVSLHDGAANAENRIAMTQGVRSDHLRLVRSFPVGNREWSIVVTSNEPRGLTLASLLVLVLGTIVSLLLMALAWLVTNRAAEDRRVLEFLTRQAAIRTSLTRELNHRVKNTLANVLSIVALTRRRSGSLDEFADGLNGRIRALSATHDLLSQRDWKDAPVREVVTSELAPYLESGDGHAEVAGPDLLLAPNEALSLGLALHELATNAAKYGALSVPEGRIAITWRVDPQGLCEVNWTESGGPPVKAPARRGFGLDLIEKIVSHELHSPVDLRFAVDGVTCTLRVPLRNPGEFAIRTG